MTVSIEEKKVNIFNEIKYESLARKKLNAKLKKIHLRIQFAQVRI